MTRDEIIIALKEMEKHFKKCKLNADVRSNAHKQFERWVEALASAENIVWDYCGKCALEGCLMEDDGK